MRMLRALILPPLVLALVLGIVLIGRSGWQATRAVRDLETAAGAAAQLRTALAVGDVDAAERYLADVADASRYASERLEGPSWSVTERLPGIGDDIAAVRRSSDLVLQATRRLGDPLLDVARRLQPDDLRPIDGRIELDTLEEVHAMLQRSAPELRELSQAAADIELPGVVPQIRASVSGLQLTLALISSLVDDVHAATGVMPQALGQDGPQRYLVLLVDSTLATPGGGSPEAYAVVEADAGRLALVETGAVADLEDAGALTIGGRDAFLAGARRVAGIAEAYATPDFSRTGRYVQRLWQQARPDLPVTGVASVDAVGLDALSAALGPADAEAGEGVDLERVLERVLAGEGESGAVLDLLSDAAVQGRLRVWSAEEEVRTQLLASGLTGIPMGDLDARPRLGVFLSNRSGRSPGEGLRLASARVRTLACDPGGQRAVLSAVIARSAAVDADGGGIDLRPVGASLLLLGPRGGTLSIDVSIDGGSLQRVRPRTIGDRPALRLDLAIASGGTTVVRTRATTAPGRTTEPRLVVPAADPPTGVRVDPTPCEDEMAVGIEGVLKP